MTVMQNRSERSLFWPLLLIGVGLVWLLTNMGLLSSANIAVLFRLWPLLLIVAGLNILVSRRSPQFSALIGVGAVLVILLLMLVGPSLGLVSSAEIKEVRYDEPMGDVTSADVTLDVGVATTYVSGLADSANLFEADLHYTGDVDYSTSGGSEKVIRLTQRGDQSTGFNLFNLGAWTSSEELRWDVGLSQDVPVNLNVNMGVGSGTFNLSEMQLTGLRVSGGVSDLNLALPSMDEPYTARISAGTGSIHITVEADAAVRFDIDGGVGEITLDLPDDAAVQIDASTGVGDINVPSYFERVGGNADDNFVGDSGVWETAGFAEADRRIEVSFKGGVGSLIVQ